MTRRDKIGFAVFGAGVGAFLALNHWAGLGVMFVAAGLLSD